MKKRWGILSILLILVIAAGLLGLRSYPQVNTILGASSQQAAPTPTAAAPDTGANTIDASGYVRTSQSATVAWQTIGTVGQVNVKVGDAVKAGTVLATLNPASLPVSIINAQNTLITAQQNLDNLTQSNTPAAQAKVDLLKASQTYTDTLNHQLNLISWTSQPAYVTAEQNLAEAQDNLNKARARLDQANADTSPTGKDTRSKLNMEFRKARRAFLMAQKQFDLLGGPPTQYQLDKAAANTAMALAKLQDAQAQYDKVKNGPSAQDVAAAKAQVQAAQATVNLARVVAPFDGTITAVDIKSGDLVAPGAAAFQIDDTSRLFVDLQVSEVDVNKIQVGQSASLSLDAVPNKQYTGKIISISPVGTSNNGSIFYTATVQIANPDASIKPGMTASASITVQ